MGLKKNDLSGANTKVRAKMVFVGAGGGTLRILQKAGLPEVPLRGRGKQNRDCLGAFRLASANVSSTLHRESKSVVWAAALSLYCRR